MILFNKDNRFDLKKKQGDAHERTVARWLWEVDKWERYEVKAEIEKWRTTRNAFLVGLAVGMATHLEPPPIMNVFWPPTEAAPSRVDKSGDPMLHFPARSLLADPVMPAFMPPQRPRIKYVYVRAKPKVRLPEVLTPNTTIALEATEIRQ